MNRIDEMLGDLARNNKKGLFPFLVAGQGGLDTTIDMIVRFQELGASGIELGFPFTDPIADGPIIQNAFSDALADGVTVAGVFQALQRGRGRITIPLVAMVSASIVYRIGIDKFLDQAYSTGFDGLIIPDLSLEEAPAIKDKVAARDMRLVMLVAPTSSRDRQERIAAIATGFIYYMSVAGITGERNELPVELVDNVRRLKGLSNMPVLVGFGIGNPDQVRLVCSVADGAIVGSAFVRRIKQAHNAGAASNELVDRVGSYLAELLTGLDT